ncbi:MAG: SOS response-associated peptidase [Candidatus Cyclonatronum sp.]|uniref:SOS response-associated peptidase n=1 Tax=Cyclonatronum sp. TaxID=3024185 RepID=UPI0025C5D60B|nr:SOS response-associated peptidase [Cyclonatronum sp.]MCH8487104.1 SOS response-associated peptidase [Cyclonatronum sp.]
MCGRYVRFSTKTELEHHFESEFKIDGEAGASYNVAPGTLNPVVLTGRAQTRGITLMKWGLIPPFADTPNIGYKMMNARSETIHEKPSFRPAFERKRCLVPANGFFEWQQTGSAKIPHFISLQNEPLFAFAGLFERWLGPHNEAVFSYTIITTQANPLLAPLHERMPVILRPEQYNPWLDPAQRDTEALRALLQPYPAEEMSLWEVPDDVNKATVNHADLIKPGSGSLQAPGLFS